MIARLLLRFILIFFFAVIGIAVFSPSKKNNPPSSVHQGTVVEHAQATSFAPGQLRVHFLKHGYKFGSITEEDYLVDAQKLLNEPLSADLLEKISPDGDIERYRPSTHEFAVMSSSGLIRSYFIANDRYWNGQE